MLGLAHDFEIGRFSSLGFGITGGGAKGHPRGFLGTDPVVKSVIASMEDLLPPEKISHFGGSQGASAAIGDGWLLTGEHLDGAAKLLRPGI